MRHRIERQLLHNIKKRREQRRLQNKNKIMTIEEIKERTKETAPYFFSKDTMSFFNQKMSDFEVEKISETEYLITAPSYWGGKLMGYTKRIFNTNTNDLHDAESR